MIYLLSINEGKPLTKESIMTTPTLTLCELNQPDNYPLESYSPVCLKIHKALQLHGLPYQRRHGKTPASFSDIHPAARVPVLLVQDKAVFETTDILKHLETISERTLIPSDPKEAAQAWLWEEMADTTLGGYSMAARWADERNWPTVRTRFFEEMPAFVRMIVPGLLRRGVMKTLIKRDVWHLGGEHCWRNFQETLDSLDALAPAKGFWCSAIPSVADVSIFAQLQSLRVDLTPWQSQQIEQRRNLCAWLDRVKEACAQA